MVEGDTRRAVVLTAEPLLIYIYIYIYIYKSASAYYIYLKLLLSLNFHPIPPALLSLPTNGKGLNLRLVSSGAKDSWVMEVVVGDTVLGRARHDDRPSAGATALQNAVTFVSVPALLLLPRPSSSFSFPFPFTHTHTHGCHLLANVC